MAAILNLTESAILIALGNFIVAVTGTAVVQGQDNLVAEPQVGDFAIMWPTLRERLATNVHSQSDITGTGTITLTTLDLTAVTGGAVQIGSPVFGPTVLTGTTIVSLGTGTGTIGTYTVNQSQTVASGPLAMGLTNFETSMKLTVQVDVHGPNSTDNTQRLVTLFRDVAGCDFFAAQNPNIQPLYIDDGNQMPFINGENQYEDRWVLQVKLQANPTVSTPQQYADALVVGLKEIDVTFPPVAL